MLKFALLVSMLIQLGAAVFALTLIRRTRYNVSWILISASFVLMAIRRLFDFSLLFWDTSLFKREEANSWIGILISVLMLTGVLFIRKIFNLQDEIELLRKENEQKVLSAVIKTEDLARQKFARELHDGLGPVLSSIKMTISAIDQKSLTPFNKEIIIRADKATNNSIASLKEIANDLSPHLLKNFGLKMAIENLVKQMFLSRNIEFIFDFGMEEEVLPEEIKISLYRILSELLNNSLKHANPKLVKIEIEETAGMFTIHYADDGCGFNYSREEDLTGKGGMGFNNIISRTKSLDGLYHIQTSPGKGFVIDFYFPKK